MMIGLIVTVIIDTSIVKVYDLIDKSFISEQTKLLLFSINTSVCLILEFIVIKYLYHYIIFLNYIVILNL